MTTPFAALDRPDGTRVYPIPHRDTGEVIELPNITGIIGLLDPKHICDWKLKMAMLGAALREDIAVQVAAGNLLPTGPPRNGELRRVAELATTAGQIIEKGHLTNDRGSAYHALTERLDELVPAGQVSKVNGLDLPKPMRDIATKYVVSMANVTIVRSEFTVCSFAHGFAGTSDRIIRFQPLDAWRAAFDQYDLGRGCFAFDNKFGTVHNTVAMQLAAVTIAETIYDAQANTHTPLPADLRTDIGFVFNPDKGLTPVDLTGAADAFLALVTLKHYGNTKPLRPALGKFSVGGDDPVPLTGDGGGAPVESVKRSPEDMAVPAHTPVQPHGPDSKGPGSPPTEPHPFDPDDARIEVAGENTAPAPIFQPLAKVIAALQPADPFAGLPDTNGRPQPDRAAKRAWLVERRDALVTIAGGRDQLAARWPVIDGAPVPTFTQSSEQTLTQLKLIQRAITDAENAVRAPWPERDDPTDPANIVVPNDDPRVLALVARGRALPPDLEQSVFAAARHEKVPRLSIGRITEAHIAIIEGLVSAAEAEWAPRQERITNAFGLAASYDISEQALCKALGVPSPLNLHGDLLGLLDMVADTICLPDRILVDRDGVLVVDQPAAVLAAYGDDRRRVWAAGREAAKRLGIESPKDSDAVLNHPLLAAALAVV
jgi:hypothetical protein